MNKTNESPSFQKKVWTVTAIVALFVVIIWIVKAIFNVLLLLFAGALIAIYFVGLAKLLERKLHWKHGICLAVSIVVSLLLLLGFFWFAGSSIASQIGEFKEVLPSAVENVKGRLSQGALGRRILETASSTDFSSKASGLAQTFFSSTFGVLGDIYVVLFLGILFTVSPKSYTSGMMQLVPPEGKDKADQVLKRLGTSLRKWLKGQIIAMLVVFVLSAIGLIVLGIPLWLVLSIIAGLLNFIPNFGPLIAMIPAVLIAFLQGPTTALIVAGLYIVVQTLESSLITPQIQKKMLDVPPALIIIAQLVMGVLTGGWGLILATPLMVVLMVLVKELYIAKYQEES